MRTKMALAVTFLTVTVVVFGGGDVSASAAEESMSQMDPRVRPYAEAGDNDLAKRWYQSAINNYEKAYGLSGEPVLLLKISKVLFEKMRRPLDAWDVARKCSALSGAGATACSEWVGAIEAQLAQKFGRVRMIGVPANATVHLDRKMSAFKVKERTTWVSPGPHAFEVEATGYDSARIAFSVGAGETLEVPIDLVPIMGTLKVECPMAGCRVKINSDVVGDLPFKRDVAPGSYLIRAEAPDHEPFEAYVDVITKRLSVISATPHRVEIALPGPASQSLVTKQENIVKTQEIAVKVAPAERSYPYRTGAWISMGLGLAMGAAGSTVYGLLWKDLSDADTMNCANYATDTECWTAYSSKTSSREAKEYASYALWGTGGAALLTGLILYFIPGNDRVLVTPTGPGDAGFTTTVRW